MGPFAVRTEAIEIDEHFLCANDTPTRKKMQTNENQNEKQRHKENSRLSGV